MPKFDDLYDVDDVQKHFRKYLRCMDCEFCFVNEKGFMCADRYYGKQLTEDEVKNNPICEGEDISLQAYIELEKEMHEEEKNDRKFN